MNFPAAGYLSDYLGFWAIWLAIAGVTVYFFRRTRGRTGRLRLIAGNFLVFLSLLWTGVVAAETYLRYIYDATDSYALMLTNFSWFQRHVHFNSNGFRDDEFAVEKAPGTVRIACVGDSFTMGWGVRDPNDTFPGRIGIALEKRTPGRYDVRNYGVPGWTTGHELTLIDEIVKTSKIDQVILGYCLNDPDDLLPPNKWFNREAAPRITWMAPTRSFLVDRLWYHLKLANDPQVRGFFDWMKEAYDDPKIWGAQTDRFRHIANTCRRSGVRLTVVVFPLFGDWGDKYRFHTCHDRVVSAWKALGIESIDLRQAYAGIASSDLVVNRYDSHPNDRAHEIASKVILDRMFGAR